jgi:DNA-binding MarR family transcriptional regulator
MQLTHLLEALRGRGIDGAAATVDQIVRTSLAIHNLNKGAEQRLGLSIVQFHLLRILRDMPGVSPQILVGAAGMHPSTLTQSLKRLLKKEYVYIGEDPKDARKKILSLTFEGNTAVQRFSEEIGELLR